MSFPIRAIHGTCLLLLLLLLCAASLQDINDSGSPHHLESLLAIFFFAKPPPFHYPFIYTRQVSCSLLFPVSLAFNIPHESYVF